MIKLENIGKKFEDQLIFKYVNLEAKPGDFIGLIGRTGCGKSTLLNIISGYEKYKVGSNKIDDIELKDMTRTQVNYYRNKRIAFLFQNFNLIEDLSVYENLKLSVNLNLFKAKEINEYLNKVGMLEYKHKKVKNLSGGQKQRIALLRAIIKDFDVLICDEPTGNLDDTNATNMMELIQELCKEKIVIMVTHKKSIANKYFNVVYNFNHDTKTFDLVKERNSKIVQSEVKTKPVFVSVLGTFIHSIKRMFILKVYNIALIAILAFFMLSFATSFVLSGGEYEQMILENESKFSPIQSLGGYSDFEEKFPLLAEDDSIDYIGARYSLLGNIKLYEEKYNYDTFRDISSTKITFNENGVEKVKVFNPTSMTNTSAKFIRNSPKEYTLETMDVNTFPYKSLIVGRMPENEFEIIVDVSTLLNLVGDFEISYSEYMNGNVPLDKIKFYMDNRHLEFYKIDYTGSNYLEGYLEQYIDVLKLDIVGFLDSRFITDYVAGMYVSEDVMNEVEKFVNIPNATEATIYKKDMTEETHDKAVKAIEKYIELDQGQLSVIETAYMKVRTMVDFNYFLSSTSLIIFLSGLVTLLVYTFSYYKYDIALYRTLGYNNIFITMILSFNNLLITTIGYGIASYLNHQYLYKWLEYDQTMMNLSSSLLLSGALVSLGLILLTNIYYVRKYQDRSINSIL